MLSLTSGDLLVSEQPIIAPAITSGSTAKQSLGTFINSPLVRRWSVLHLYRASTIAGKPRQRTARTEHNLHPQERRLNRALDVEIFGKSGNESYEMAKIMAMRRTRFEKGRAAKDGFQASQTAKAWRGPPCAVTPMRDYDRSPIL